MNKRALLYFITSSVFLTLAVTSCKKEEITQVITQNVDSMAVSTKLLTAKWNIITHEREHYNAGVLVDKTLIYMSGTNTTIEFKSDKTYISVYMGTPAGTGTWQLLTPNYLVLDKGNATQERYYYLLVLDNSNAVARGPFKSNGQLFDNTYLFTTYYSR